MEGQVDPKFFAAQLLKFKMGLSQGFGWTPAMMDDGQLHIVTGAEVAKAGLIATAVTFGTGSTTLSVVERYLDWAIAHPPAKDYLALHIDYMLEFVAEGSRRGEALRPKSRNIAFALARAPAIPVLPAGHEFTRLEKSQLDPLWRTGVFHNGLGEKDEPELFERAVNARAARDERGDLAALAAIWELAPGVWEIGVDVRRNARGRGLATALVLQATHDILDSGHAPFYSCGASNIRSQRTALGCGYLPACSLAAVVPKNV